jgi:long-chain acyl-CoA synthetase
MDPVATPAEDVQVGVLPFFHVFAMTVVMHASIWFGMKIVMKPKFDVGEVLELVKKHRPSYLPGVPAIFNAIANHPKVGSVDFSCLKFCLAGGAPMPVDVNRLFTEKTGTSVIGEGYGLTESSPVATCNPVKGKVKIGTVGLPLPGTIIEIVSTEDGKTILPVGQRGEVCIRGPQLMKGYYKKPEETSDVLRDGRLHTGDVGYLDEEGYLVLVDRIKDLILVRGYNVYPRYVEEAIYLHPFVEECIVAGVPDKERGETVFAWVKPVSGKQLTEAELLEFLKDKISPIEIPRKITIRNKPLPKTAVGKLSRKDLLIEEGYRKA